MTISNATNEQLELGFNNLRAISTPRENRIARANWWFTQMRDVVGRAMDWNAIPQPRPEQIWIRGAHREVKV